MSLTVETSPGLLEQQGTASLTGQQGLTSEQAVRGP
jgi:hypothetical protein